MCLDAVRMQSGSMAAEYASSVQELKKNAVEIRRMYVECTQNVTRMSQVYQEYCRDISR